MIGKHWFFWLLIAVLASACASQNPAPANWEQWPLEPVAALGVAPKPNEAAQYQTLAKLLKQGQLTQALTLAETSLAQEPDQPNLWLVWANLLKEMGKTQEALDGMTQAIETHPQLPGLLVARGVFLRQLGYEESARLDLLKAYQDTEYRSFGLLLSMARLKEQEKDFPQAYELVTQAMQLKPDEVNLWFLKARLELGLYRIEDALASSQRLVEIAPDQLEFQRLYVELLIGTKNMTAAEQHLQQAAKQNPKVAWFPLRLAKQYLEMNRMDEAKILLEASVREFPEEAELHFYLAALYLEEDQSPQAVTAYEKGLKLDPEAEIPRLQLAMIYLKLEQVDKAIAQYEFLRSKGSANVQVYEGLARIYSRQEDNHEAEKVILDALRQQLVTPSLLVEYGNILFQRGKYQEAAMAFEKVLESKPRNFYVLGRLGNIYRYLHEYTKAKTTLDRAILLKPESTWLRGFLVDLYTAQGQWGNALGELDRMLALDQQQFWPHAQKALIHLRLGQYEASLTSADRALVHGPQEAQMHEIRAQALENLGRLSEAEAAYMVALEADPGNALLLTRLAYCQLESALEKAKLNLDEALDSQDFEYAGLELYYHLRGTSYQQWGFGKDSPEAEFLKWVVLRKTALANEMRPKLKGSPHAKFLFFFADYMQNSGDAELSLSPSEVKAVKHPWHHLYLGIAAMKLIPGEKELNEDPDLEGKAQDQRKAALAHFRAAYVGLPDNLWVQAKLAIAEEQLGNHPEAIRLWKLHLAAHPANLWGQLRLALNYDLVQEGRLSEQVYLQILEKRPDEAIALNNLAWLYATSTDPALQNKIDNALALSLKAVSLSPSSANLDTLAEIYYIQKDYEKALKTIERALDQDRKSLDYFKKQKKKILKALEQN